LKETGAPFAYGPGDTSDAGDPLKPPLRSTAYGTTGSGIGVSIYVYDTAEDAADQKAQIDEFADAEVLPWLTAGCGTIFLEALISADNPKATRPPRQGGAGARGSVRTLLNGITRSH
jgi:hypothetical protein